MKKNTALLAYAALAIVGWKYLYGGKGGLKGLDGMGEYPAPGSRQGYYSSAAYAQWYTNSYLPYYVRMYGSYPPAYLAYQQQQYDYTNLFSQDASGNYTIDPDRPTPIQAPRFQYPSPSYFPAQYGYQPQLAYNRPWSPYAVSPQEANIPGQVNMLFPM